MYVLPYKDEVIHLSHLLSFDLNDGPDVIRALKDLNRKANRGFTLFIVLLNVFL